MTARHARLWCLFALMLTVGGAWLAMYGAPLPAPAMATGRESKPGTSAGKVGATRPRRNLPAELGGAHRVDPRMMRRVGARAFLIQRPHEHRPPGDAAGFARSLLAASARGEAVASYQLYLVAADCNTAVSPGIVETYQMTRHLLAPDYAAKMALDMEQCEDLLADPELSNRRHWLNLAVLQGSIEAALVYAASIEDAIGGPDVWAAHPDQVIAYKQAAMAHLQQAAALGSADALLSLSQAYWGGFLVPADPAMVLAYVMAYEHVNPSEGSSSLVALAAEDVNAEQKKAARQQAVSILEQCCK